MKKIAFLLILIGLSVGAALPWVQSNFFSNEIHRLELMGLSEDGSAEAIMDLRKSENPVRISFLANYQGVEELPSDKISLFVKISDREGTLLASIVSFEMDSAELLEGSQALDLSIVNDGAHALSLSFADNHSTTRPDIENVTAIFVRNAGGISDQYPVLGFVLAMLGFYLLFRSRWRKKTEKIKWGRGKQD